MTSGHSNVQGVSTKSQTLLNTDNARVRTFSIFPLLSGWPKIPSRRSANGHGRGGYHNSERRLMRCLLLMLTTPLAYRKTHSSKHAIFASSSLLWPHSGG